MHTNHGEIVIDLFGNHAPVTVENFVGLAKGEKDYSTVTGAWLPKRSITISP